MKNRGIAVVGDVMDVNCLSGSPYYFYIEGKKAGLFNQPWLSDLNRFKTSRLVWNVKSYLTGKGIGGYQYSEDFLCKAEAAIPKEYLTSEIISFNQVFPRASSIIKN